MHWTGRSPSSVLCTRSGARAFLHKPTTVLLSAVHRCSSTNMTYRMRTAHGTIKLSCRLPFRRDLCMSSFRWMPTISLPKSITSTWLTAKTNRPATCWRRSIPLTTGWTATRATPTAITMMAGNLCAWIFRLPPSANRSLLWAITERWIRWHGRRKTPPQKA